MDSELFPMCLSLTLLPEWKPKDVGMIWLSVNRVDFQGRWANLSIKSKSQGSLMPVWEQLYRVLFRTLCELTMLSPHFIPAEIFHVLIWFENGFWLVLLNHRYADTAVAVYVSNMNLLSPKLFGLEVKKKVHVFQKKILNIKKNVSQFGCLSTTKYFTQSVIFWNIELWLLNY